jgi:hypothetical protein
LCPAETTLKCKDFPAEGQTKGTDSNGVPATAAASQITFDSTTGTFSGETTASHDGVIAAESLTGTYAVASNCTGTGNPAGGSAFSFVVTSTGFLAVHLFSEGFAVKQGFPTCTNAGVKGRFGFETTGVFLAEASDPAVAFIGELKLTVNPSGEGVIRGHVAASEDGTFVNRGACHRFLQGRQGLQGHGYHNAEGTARNALQLVVVDCGKQMPAVETDADTDVSGTLVKGNK